MAMRFAVLGSGSAGNASLLETDGLGVLIDAGFGPRQLVQRLAAVGSSWAGVHAVLLTHTHGDHWRETTLGMLVRRRIPLYCHAEHGDCLLEYSVSFTELKNAGLVHEYRSGEDFVLDGKLWCRPLPVSHDGGPTFGFRFEGAPNLFGEIQRVGYVADLGCWDAELADCLADVDLLALEFNHDEELESNSGRSPYLIARVLGEYGHLSNAQAAGLLRQTLARSSPGRLRHVVQLHLSGQCNKAKFAVASAQAVLPPGVSIHTARQDAAGPSLEIAAAAAYPPRRPRLRRKAPSVQQPSLPGLSAAAETPES